MDIYNLIKKQEKRKEYKDELFKKILQQAHRRIEFCSNSGDKYAIFTIPLYMPGFPLFNKSECCVYLLYELQQNGFDVRSYSDQYIYISWSHVLEKYKSEKNLLEYEEPKLLENSNNVDKTIKKSNELIFNNNTFNLLK
jgi:hypothetical protein